MNTTQLIDKLTEMREKHGDQEVTVSWEGLGHDFTIYRGRHNDLVIDADEEYCRAAYEHPEDKRKE